MTIIGRLQCHEELDDEDVAALLGYITDLEELCDTADSFEVFGDEGWRFRLGLADV